MIIGIVAVSQNYAVGRDGKLPWHYSSDMKFFKRNTIGNAIVMGSHTWKAIGKPLPSRLNIVLSRSVKADAGAVVLRSRSEIEAIAEYLRCDTYVIGGAATYATFAGLIEKWIVTEVPLDIPDADTFMPRDFLAGFERSTSEDLEPGLAVKTFVRK